MHQILEPILSLLDQKSLLASRLVCSTWAAIARPCLSIEAIWRDCSLSEAKIVCLERLVRTDILVVQYHPKNTSITTPSSAVGAKKDRDEDRDEDRDSILFGDLTPPLATLQRTARVKKLVLKDAYDFHTRLEVFLEVFPTLSTLVLDKLIKGPLRIDILLASCPSLKTLSVEYVLTDRVLWGPPPSQRSIVIQRQQQKLLGDSLTKYIDQPLASRPPLRCGYGLQTLILRHAMSSQSAIKSMLQTLPSLLSLEIRFLKIPNSHPVNPPIFHRPTFFRDLSGSCPNLQHLHFSIFHRPLLVPDSMTMCEALPTLTGLGLPCQDLESYRQPIGIGIDETDAGGVGPDTPRLGVLEFYVNHLTRLELLAYRFSQEDSLISNLHAFLTEAVHLQHLVAPKVNYWTEFLEMKDVQPSNGAGASILRTTADGQHHYQHQHPATSFMSAAASGANNSQWSASKTKTWGWACRNLETLHLGFKAKETYTPNGHDDSSPRKRLITEESRILFGFIARICPQLRDLHIRKYSLDLSLEGGLCLLTQLRELEQLVIWSQTKGFRLREKDVDWIGYNGVDDVFLAGGSGEQQQEMTAVGATAASAAVTPTTSTSTSQSTITIATRTGTGAGTNASTAPPVTTPAITTAAHNATAQSNNSTNSSNSNPNSSNGNPNSSSSAPTVGAINPNTGSTNKGPKKSIKAFLYKLSGSSSSSSSIPPKTRPQQHVPVIQKHPTELYTNMPSRVMEVFKTDDDWLAKITLTRSAIGWTNLVVATAVSSTGSQQAAPLFAKKDQSVYRCWPHLRTMVWAIDPVNIFHDERASKVFSNLRPDIEFKVQKYLE
ncbi:hypothetical protein KI688_012742 [Linnemannia hyalina]|uniref:F-box domain-containing protein n=1 Tax=Linnemannia hyalina TaxID=64524 RepID=A0A9P7XT60_9FUNG|nr:hypothetical protein KI688_012742 [Linnemannia hyalina]